MIEYIHGPEVNTIMKINSGEWQKITKKDSLKEAAFIHSNIISR